MKYQQILRSISDCRLPAADCRCNICVRQPPSLGDSAAHLVFNNLFNLEQFELTVDTTFQQYVFAVKSGRANFWNLLPPEFPSIRIWFRFDSYPHKLHRDFPGIGAWHAELNYNFSSTNEAISLIKKIDFCAIVVIKVSSSLIPVQNTWRSKKGVVCNRFTFLYHILTPFLFLIYSTSVKVQVTATSRYHVTEFSPTACLSSRD
jgi:hypothetical protein